MAISLFFSISFFIAGIAAAIYLNCWQDILPGLYSILTLPAPLVTDYYQLGNLSSAFFNAAICGLACSAFMILLKCDCRPFLGFAIPAMLPGALRLHKGYNLFNGGLAFGLLGLFLYAYMYKTFNVLPPESFEQENTVYAAHGNSYQAFVVTYFSILCTIAGRYGKRFGVLAGIMCAIMCTSTSALHGALVLYNGSLTSGITALILVPCLEYYWEGRKKEAYIYL